MRPPTSNLDAEASGIFCDVTSPGLTLDGVGDWRNLTTDTSIQIAHLGDHSTREESFHRNHGHANCLRHVDTIESAPPECQTQYRCSRHSSGSHTARTLVSLDSLATTSGRLLDSRLIFSSSRDGGKTSVSRRKVSQSFSMRTQRPVSLSPTTSDKLWHSDSELYYPSEEGLHMESKSVEDISTMLVKPIEVVVNSTKVSEIKPVPLLESESRRQSSDSETNEDEANNSYIQATTAGIKPNMTGNKVYRKISKSLRRKRKTFSNVKYLNEMFKTKDTKQETNTLQRPRHLEHTKSNSFCMKQPLTKGETENTKYDSLRKRHTSYDSTRLPSCVRTELETKAANQTKRRPVLGVRMRKDEKLILDDLDLEFVCNVKRRLSTNAISHGRKNIKTNGSLCLKQNTCRVEKMTRESPKRIGNKRCGASALRLNTKCLVSTV